MNKSGSNLIKLSETESEAETRPSQTKVIHPDDNKSRSGASDHTDNDQEKLMTTSVAEMDQNKSNKRTFINSGDNSDKRLGIVVPKQAKVAVETALLTTTGFRAEYSTEASIDCASQNGTEPANENNEKANAIDADSTEMRNQSIETLSQDTNVSNTDNH